MPLDVDLQELRRRVTLDPRDARAAFQLATALERCGARGDAVELAYRARAVGAEGRECRALLSRHGARASPWTHVRGDSEHTLSAPVRGARAGRIVAKHSSEWILGTAVDEDGSILAIMRGRITVLSSTDLRANRRWKFSEDRLEPVVASERLLVHGTSKLYARTANGETFEELPTNGTVLQLAALSNGKIILTQLFDPLVTVFDGSLREEARLSSRLGAASIFTTDRGAAAELLAEQRGSVFQVALRDGRVTPTRIGSNGGVACFANDQLIAFSLEEPIEAGTKSIVAIDPQGRIVWTCPLDSALGLQLASAPDGSVLALRLGRTGGARLTRIAPGGRLEWTHESVLELDGGIVVDREGYAFVVGSSGRDEGLLAIAPDGSLIFAVPEIRRVLAIDSLGRVLAVRGPRELVAIE